ncbi:hypothetical protein [Streptomyces griseochromogenes]|uniref:hypothetical protein n=1 Tax=Streptomyces griseochromogenes TaxID=68214 RepID=UPI003795D2D7
MASATLEQKDGVLPSVTAGTVNVPEAGIDHGEQHRHALFERLPSPGELFPTRPHTHGPSVLRSR